MPPFGILVENMKMWTIVALAAGVSAQPEWPKSGGDLFNRNYSSPNHINRGNVANLKGVWRVRLAGSGSKGKYSGEAQPAIEDGIVYIVTGADDVFAISVKTGKIVWKYEAGLADEITTLCCGWISRGHGPFIVVAGAALLAWPGKYGSRGPPLLAHASAIRTAAPPSD